MVGLIKYISLSKWFLWWKYTYTYVCTQHDWYAIETLDKRFANKNVWNYFGKLTAADV